MATVTYDDADYQRAQQDLFSHPVIAGLEPVLPPGVSKETFDQVLKELVDATAKDAVYAGDDLKEYVDPYEIPEEHERKIPSAAVW